MTRVEEQESDVVTINVLKILQLESSFTPNRTNSQKPNQGIFEYHIINSDEPNHQRIAHNTQPIREKSEFSEVKDFSSTLLLSLDNFICISMTPKGSKVTVHFICIGI